MNNEKWTEEKKKEFIEAWEDHITDFDRLFWNTNEVQKMAVKGSQSVLRHIVKTIVDSK